jgi:cold shock CspA family protein
VNRRRREQVRPVPADRAARGTIANIRPNRGDGRGFGAITPDGGGPDLFFANGSVEGPAWALSHALRRVWRTRPGPERPFDRLCVGQRVTFAVGVDPHQPHRARAEHLRPCGE